MGEYAEDKNMKVGNIREFNGPNSLTYLYRKISEMKKEKISICLILTKQDIIKLCRHLSKHIRAYLKGRNIDNIKVVYRDKDISKNRLQELIYIMDIEEYNKSYLKDELIEIRRSLGIYK